MKRIDRILEDVQKQVELYGKSGGDTVFKDNIQFTISQADYTTPLTCNLEEAISDVAWFFRCAKQNRIISHPEPHKSFWVRIFGEDALPYGSTWNLAKLKENLRNDSTWRRGMLFNYQTSDNPPCVLCYQFQNIDFNTLDCTVTMRSSDVAKVLAQDVVMCKLILDAISSLVDLQPGKLTFNIANAHVYYEDLEYQEEFTIDYGD